MKLEREHQRLNEEIISLYEQIVSKGKPKKLTLTLSLLFHVSDETIRNYLKGRGSDGALKKAIIAELKKVLKSL